MYAMVFALPRLHQRPSSPLSLFLTLVAGSRSQNESINGLKLVDGVHFFFSPSLFRSFLSFFLVFTFPASPMIIIMNVMEREVRFPSPFA